jgi:transposase InsO family protein
MNCFFDSDQLPAVTLTIQICIGSAEVLRRLAVILDSFSRKVVGWAVDRTLMSSHLTVAALKRAVADRRPQAGLVHHSDRGLQYASPEYVAALDRHGMIASMSRPANPYDNASCESFMKTLKREESTPTGTMTWIICE